MELGQLVVLSSKGLLAGWLARMSLALALLLVWRQRSGWALVMKLLGTMLGSEVETQAEVALRLAFLSVPLLLVVVPLSLKRVHVGILWTVSVSEVPAGK